MTRPRWIGWVLVAATVVACSTNGTVTDPSSSPGAAAACPESPALADVIALDRDPGPLTIAFRPLYGHYAEAALACYGNSDLQFTAFVAAPEGLGGVVDYVIEPAWLVSRGHWLAVDDSIEPEGFYSGPFLPLAVPPAQEAVFDNLGGSWVVVSGHFADPAAETCRVTDRRLPVAPTAEETADICRTAFVVTGVQPAPPPSSG
jgi:hypothetical protein